MVIDSNCSIASHNNFYSVKKVEEEGMDLSVAGYEEHSKSDKISNFKEICEMFPNVSFVVVSDGSGFLDGYEGICKTGSFSYLGTPSIMLNEELLERFHSSEEDNRNIIAIIKMLTRDYSYWGVSFARMGDSVSPNGYSYTAIDIHYSEKGNLTFSQMCTNDGPIFEKDLNKNSFKIEEYMEAFLMFQKNYLLKYLAKRDIEDDLFGKPSLNEVKKNYKQFVYQKDITEKNDEKVLFS